MIVIDSLLMSDSSESDLLWVKLNLEQSVVSRWIIQENSYNLKGEHKGLHVAKVLEEERFKPFSDRITLISANQQIHPGCIDEHNNFIRENWQRSICSQTLQQINEDGLVLVSDVDESVDFSDDKRKEIFFTNVLNDSVTWCYRRRYWYDYDNEAKLYNIRIPVLPLSIAKDPNALAQARHYSDDSRSFGSYDEPIAFEYSYVFKSEQDVNSKKKNYAHAGFTEECVKNALKLNVWPRSKIRGEKIRWGGEDEFEIIELTEKNSPKFVRDNLATLKTNLVDPNYKENRKSWTSEYTE